MEGKRVWRTVYLAKREIDNHPEVDPARLPLRVYSTSDNLDFARSDLTYLREDQTNPPSRVGRAWIETRIEQPWERTDD